MDAGVPGAYQLTTEVYEALKETNFEAARLYGFVLGKLVTWRARKGVSPFSAVGIEDVYAALKKFIGRSEDIISEFVNSWDEFSPNSFDGSEFSEILSRCAPKAVGNGRIRHPSVQDFDRVGNYISKTILNRPDYFDASRELDPFISSLVFCLDAFTVDKLYIRNLTSYMSEHAEAVGSLNYDRVIEESFKNNNILYDYGLSVWNEKKYIRFSGSGVKFIKLHGSIDWYIHDDNVDISKNRKPYYRHGMIFGSQSEKLVAEGPFLQLRTEFQNILRKTNKLGIVGYSFQDDHVNAMLRVWMSTRNNSKLVILDPSEDISMALSQVTSGIRVVKGKFGPRFNVETVHVRDRAENGMEKFLDELRSEVAPSKMSPKGHYEPRVA